ncbi:MAG: hypothetical protein KME30_19915 [Iphinoe sp. HA4291-MV1]|jgi:hypothetical protein|nr:hypothetical protein [Iphinoe sp. HA4291-MV1]
MVLQGNKRAAIKPLHQAITFDSKLAIALWVVRCAQSPILSRKYKSRAVYT